VSINSARMFGIYDSLQHGDSVPTVDLQWFVKRCEETIDVFSRVPQFNLFVADLIHNRNNVQSYLDARRREKS